MLRKKRRSTFAAKALVICILALGTWFHSSSAYGMGPGERIEGPLKKTVYGLPVGQCVVQAKLQTGTLSIDSISYNASHLRCDMFDRVDDLVNDPPWCSQYVVPNAPDECLVGVGGGEEEEEVAQLSCSSQSLGANTFQVSWNVTNNQPVTQITVQRDIGFWQSFSVSTQANTCISAAGCSSYRVYAVNSAGTSAYCYTATSCDSGGEFEY